MVDQTINMNDDKIKQHIHSKQTNKPDAMHLSAAGVDNVHSLSNVA